LRSLPLWAECEASTLDQLARAATFRTIPRGKYLFLRGEPPESVCVLRSGSIAIVLSNADGRELVINEMRPGDCLGELGALTGLPRSASALARTDCQVLAVAIPAFCEALRAEPDLTFRLLVLTSQQLRVSGEREGVLAFMDAEARVARLLLQLDVASEAVGYITISQTELGHWTGLTRQTVAAILGRWRRRGWLATGRGRIVLFDYARLREVGQQF
jgi:CRP-like cAMP-binding protein